MESPRTPPSDGAFTQSDLQTAMRVLRAVTEHHGILVSEIAAGHINNSMIVLETIGPLVARTDPAVRPSDRVDGLCPCQLADLGKSARDKA